MRPPGRGSAAVRAAAALVVALVVTASVGGARGGPAAAPTDSAALAGVEPADTLIGTRLAAALRATGLRPARGGRVVNDCDEAVVPETYSAEVGGAVGRARLVVIGGGPKLPACYGNAGRAFWLLRKESGAFRVVLRGYGLLSVLSTEHAGVKDLAIGGPGFEFPVFVWEDSIYEHQGWIADSLLPPPVYRER